MSMVVRNNLSAVNTLNTLNRNHTALAKSLQTVSTGMRINSAKDDASGYAISERMRVQIRSLNQDNQNTQNGHSMMKVAEGAVQSTVDILKTLKEKVINAANDTNTDSDRAQIQKELNQSIDQINDNANVTYNGKYLVDGSKNGKSDGTYTTLTNSSLHKDMSGGTALTALQDRNGDNLGIQVNDTVSVSYVQNGRTFSTDVTVTDITSLSDILTAAEALNTGTTFANANNPSVMAAMGVTSENSLISIREQERDLAQQTYNAAVIAQGTAQSQFTTAETALNNYNGAKGLVDTAYSTFTTYYGEHAYDALVGASMVNNNNNRNALDSQYTTWKNTGTGRSDLPGYGNPDSVAGNQLSTLLTDSTVLDTEAGASYVYALGIQSRFSSYKTKYDAFIGNYSATAGQTLNEAYNSKRQALAAANTAVTNASNALATAEHNLALVAGPIIVDSVNVGLNYAGALQTTSDDEKALTITAQEIGIKGQIAGFTISVTDAKGNIKKSANAKLDAWEETIRAENARTEDNAIVLQTGTKANQAIKIRLTDMRAQALGLQGDDGTTLNVSTQEKANAAINVLDNALKKALDQQTTIGSIESRLGYTSTNLTTAIENVTASESTIRDADMAMAMTEYTKNNILAQSSQAMLAQANQSNNQVLSLLR